MLMASEWAQRVTQPLRKTFIPNIMPIYFVEIDIVKISSSTIWRYWAILGQNGENRQNMRFRGVFWRTSQALSMKTKNIDAMELQKYSNETLAPRL